VAPAAHIGDPNSGRPLDDTDRDRFYVVVLGWLGTHVASSLRLAEKKYCKLYKKISLKHKLKKFEGKN
jgi:hypothetical protein